MKIICVDNFARESIADTLIAENVNEYWGKKIVDGLNDKIDVNGNDFFTLKDDNYVLWRGMEELI